MKNKYLLATSAYSNPDLLKKCVESFPDWIDYVVFFDGKNWKNVFKDILDDGIVCFNHFSLDQHVGVGGAWNELLKEAFVKNDYDAIIVVGSDVEFKEGYLEGYIKDFEDQNCGFSTARGQGFNCWCMTRKCYETVGEFDLNLFPAYYDDNDIMQRIRLAKVKMGDIGNFDLILHWGSATIRKEKKYEIANNNTFPMNQRYFVNKWGNLPEGPYYDHPFNNPNLGIKDWVLNKEEYELKKRFWDV
jgi:hypothetical protein